MKLTSNLKPARFTLSHQAQWFVFLGDDLNSGMNLPQALAFSGRIFPKELDRFQKMERQLVQGGGLAETMKPWLRTDLYYQLKLAEQEGNLAGVVRQIGEFLTKQHQQRQKLRGLLQYPLLLLTVLGVFMMIMVHYVGPQLSSWQQGDWGIKPRILQILVMTVSAIMTILIWQGIVLLKMSRLERINWLCHLPVVGNYWRLYWHYYLVNVLGMMIAHGMSFQDIHRVTRQYDHQSMVYQVIQQLTRQTQRGQSIERVILKTIYLPDELASYFNRGLTTSELGDELLIYSRMLFQRFINQTERLLELVQPILFMLIAMIIGGMYLSLLLPIYHSLQSVN